MLLVSGQCGGSSAVTLANISSMCLVQCSLQMADVSPRSLLLRDVLREGMSATQ